ncbi:putative EamA domain-containing protein [Lupinus albus]|uniref:WAT1-related protein n=1 Tax=Lupinus albus TaxID=3870 RepID=A0A6A4QIU2_LUPAL|nr:putative EamA domain-containing protein [Lupinus albus]
MEKLAIKSKSTQAKIFGTILSILGALIVVLYKGRILLSDSNQLQSPATDAPISLSSQTNWILGGSLLAIEFLLVPVMYILQASILNQYPSEIIVVFTYCVCLTFISAPICLLLESNWSAWNITPDIRLVAILSWGILITCICSVVYAWGLRIKGPVYISIFKPASIVIAATLSVIFLGEALYFGTVLGAVILSLGFYAVIWGKAQEEEMSEEIEEGITESLPNSKTPLLKDSNVKDNSEIMYTNCP